MRGKMNDDTNFSINDLRTMLQLLTVVSSRGAIKPDEMMVVGELYSKIAKFISAAEQAASKTEPAETEGNN